MGNSQNKRNLFCTLGSQPDMLVLSPEERGVPLFSDVFGQPFPFTPTPVHLTKEDVKQFKLIIKMDPSFLNRTVDPHRNTLLHVSVHKTYDFLKCRDTNACSEDLFNFLLKQPNISIDKVNFQGFSPLMLAVMNNKETQALKLITKGADINLVDRSGRTALHWAIIVSPVSLCHALIRNGIELDIQDSQGLTALQIACQFEINYEKISMLLYYGSDPLICCYNGDIPLLQPGFDMHELELSQLFLNYMHKSDLELKILLRALYLKSPIFNLLLEFDEINGVTYNEADLCYLNECLPDFDLSQFELFFKKFDYVVKDMLTLCCTLTNYLTSIEGMRKAPLNFLDFLSFLLDTHLVNEVIESCCQSISTISSLVKIFHKNKFSLEKLTELVCHMLSYGMRMTTTDLNAVYVFYGRCELFRIMLHMDIEPIDGTTQCCPLYDYEVVQESIIAHFIFDIDLNLDKFLDNPQWLLSMDLDMLLNYFADPKLQEFFSSESFDSHRIRSKLMKLPSVPSLTDLARNAARDHIIKKCNIRSCRQFYTVLKWLPVSDVYKKILSFERKLYDV